MKEITYDGKVYKTDGKQIWIDGVLATDVSVPPEVRSLAVVEVLSIDGGKTLFHDNKFYEQV